MVGAVGEMASVKRRKLWKTGKDGLCCSSSAIQTRLGPSSLLEEQSGVPIVTFSTRRTIKYCTGSKNRSRDFDENTRFEAC